MNRKLWNLIVDFDLDRPRSEYGFSTRLAHENRWPTGFTEEAIIEYKKFMYLAATTNSMVSPSEIVDIVWHQHLIFTKSYDAFCELLGKKIEHIPSTHNRDEEDKFELARAHTKMQYELNFGEQPKAFWHYHSIYQPMKLKKSGIHVRTLLLVGAVAMLLLIGPAYSLLKDFYATIDNPYFLLEYIGLCGISVLLLEVFNQNAVKEYMEGINKETFVFKLSPIELIYMKYERIDDLVHASINKLIKERKITIERNRKLTVPQHFECANTREFVIKEFVQLLIQTHYKTVVFRMQPKAIFQNTKRFVEALRKEFMNSRLYVRLMTINISVYAIVLTLGFTRIMTGISREKPVGLIIFVWLLSAVTLISFLSRVMNVLTKKVIPSFYRTKIEASPENHNTSEWKYFVHGQAALTAVLIPLLSYEPIQPGGNGGNGSSSSNGGCGSSCSSGCGSSCGGGCGGCGGD